MTTPRAAICTRISKTKPTSIMTRIFSVMLACLAGTLLFLTACLMNAAAESPSAFRSTHPVAPLPNDLVVAEAEEFKPGGGNGWQARRFGENYYAATFANSLIQEIKKMLAKLISTIRKK